MLRVEVLCEDKSSVPVFQHFLGGILASRAVEAELFVHPHRGKGRLPKTLSAKPRKAASSLLELLPAKLRAYRRMPDWQKQLLVLALDSDNEDRDSLYRQLEYVIREEGDGMRFVIGIATEEVEAWFLGDRQALLAAYPQADIGLLDAYEQDSVCGSWELLARMIEGEEMGRRLMEIGYPAIGLYKSRWAEAIVPQLKAERNQSPSLRQFLQMFTRILDAMPDAWASA